MDAHFSLTLGSHEVVCLTSQSMLVVICSLVSSSHSSYWMVSPGAQVIWGTLNSTSRGTSLHSLQVTGSQSSLPAHTWFPFSSVSHLVTQFCLVTFLHSGIIF